MYFRDLTPYAYGPGEEGVVVEPFRHEVSHADEEPARWQRMMVEEPAAVRPRYT